MTFDHKSFEGRAVIFLVVLNLLTLAMLWFFLFRRPPGREPLPPRDGGPMEASSFVKRELALSEEQSKAFDALRERLGTAVHPVHEEIRKLMAAAVEDIFKPDGGAASLGDLAARIGEERAKEVTQLFLHLKGLAALCRPDQLATLHAIMNEFLVKIGAVLPPPPKGLGGERGPRPPSERRGEGGPPPDRSGR